MKTGLRACCLRACIAALSGALLLCAAPVVHARDTITWANLHFPPWMILKGNSQGQGVWDALLAELIAKLPEYDHEMVEMKNVRYEQLAKQQQHVCKVYYFRAPEREEILHYSIPSVVFLANHVVMRSERAKELGNPKSIALAQLMDDPRFEGAFIEGRSYGKEIDKILAARKNRPQLRFKVVDNQNLFEFLSLGRTDYLLEFPAVRAFFEQDLDIRPALVNIAIEGAASYNVTHVTCVKNDWGKRVIERVDEILKRHIATAAHRNAVLRWYRPDEQSELSKHYWQILVAPTLSDNRTGKP